LLIVFSGRVTNKRPCPFDFTECCQASLNAKLCDFTAPFNFSNSFHSNSQSSLSLMRPSARIDPQTTAVCVHPSRRRSEGAYTKERETNKYERPQVLPRNAPPLDRAAQTAIPKCKHSQTSACALKSSVYGTHTGCTNIPWPLSYKYCRATHTQERATHAKEKHTHAHLFGQQQQSNRQRNFEIRQIRLSARHMYKLSISWCAGLNIELPGAAEKRARAGVSPPLATPAAP
jgi:hypothetical protein